MKKKNKRSRGFDFRKAKKRTTRTSFNINADHFIIDPNLTFCLIIKKNNRTAI
jgi:hypothetical protein